MTDDDAAPPGLSAAELAALAERFDGAEVEALALTGSHARGEATAHSDVDLLRFTQAEPTIERERYHLWLLDGRLVSVSTTTISAKGSPDARAKIGRRIPRTVAGGGQYVEPILIHTDLKRTHRPARLHGSLEGPRYIGLPESEGLSHSPPP